MTGYVHYEDEVQVFARPYHDRTAYTDLAQMGAITQGRITRSEVKYVSTINVAEIRKRADELAKNYRDLDARIQELNWQAGLVE